MQLKVKNRNLFYFILSVIVVIIHSEGCSNYVEEGTVTSSWLINFCDVVCYGITRAAIPCFLFFSGFFLYNNLNTIDDLKRKIKSRIKTVIMPFFVWNIISMIWSYLLSILPFTKNNIAKRELFTFSIENIYRGLILSDLNTHNWYLAQLAIFVVLLPITYYIFKNKKSATAFLVLVFGLYFLRIDLPIYQKEFCGIIYFLGAYIGKFYYEDFIDFSTSKDRRKWYKVICYTAICIGIQLIEHYYLNHDYFLIGIPRIISGFTFWILFNCIDFKKDYDFYKQSFFIYLSHFIVAPCVNKLIWIFLPHNDFFALFNLFGGVAITILIIIVVGTLIRNKIKLLWFVLTGESCK